MRRLAAALTLLLSMAMMGLVAPSANAAPYCGIRWGSLAKVATPGSNGLLTNIRAGQHPCYDRLVLDVDGDIRGYHVQYVSQVRQDGSGLVVPVRGGAKLEVIARVGVTPADSFFTGNGSEVINTRGYQTFRQVAWAGSFEGQSTVALGVRARLPFRVFLLDGPGNGSRMVVDVAHRW